MCERQFALAPVDSGIHFRAARSVNPIGPLYNRERLRLPTPQYALPLGVMLHSVGAQTPGGTEIEAYILDDGVSAADKRNVTASLPGNIQAHWRQPSFSPSRLPTWGRMSRTTYQKLTLADWLPRELNCVIWLDCDLLVLADISRLWREDLSGFVALASQNQRVPLVSSPFGAAGWRDLGLARDSKYFITS
jgi:hypothetical protein